MPDNTYQGWTNRETWALMLWVNNDEGLYDLYRETVQSGLAAHSEDSVRSLTETLLRSDEYRAEFGDEWPEGLRQVANEVGSLWRIDWAEVVESLTENV